MLFASRPSTIEAVQWTGENDADMHMFGDGKVRVSASLGSEHDPSVKSLELLAGKDGRSGVGAGPRRPLVGQSAG